MGHGLKPISQFSPAPLERSVYTLQSTTSMNSIYPSIYSITHNSEAKA
jgi:hypothetical protein